MTSAQTVIQNLKEPHVDNTSKSPAILSLCPGILGLERGVERAIGKIRVAAYVEIEAFVVANLVAAMESGFLDPVPIWTDVKTFDPKPFRNKIHGVIGGYPCQPFSQAGLRGGEDDARHLWPFIREIIRSTKPEWCFFENVRGHISLGFETVYKELSELGYSVEAGIFSAEEVGATHKRERLFILAVGYPENIHKQYDGYEFKQSSIEDRRPSTELANTEDRFWRLLLQSGRSQQNNSEFMRCSKNMANTESVSKREQTNKADPQPITRKAWNEFEHIREDVGECTVHRWPAGQGTFQYDWEEPRAVKPGLGCTIDGYNFRTDLLRAYGNAVVEQTAELAFRTLLEKHFKVNPLAHQHITPLSN